MYLHGNECTQYLHLALLKYAVSMSNFVVSYCYDILVARLLIFRWILIFALVKINICLYAFFVLRLRRRNLGCANRKSWEGSKEREEERGSI